MGAATESLYNKLSKDSEAQQEALSELKATLTTAKADSAAALKNAKEVFASRVDSLTNAITANAKSFEAGLERATGVAMSWKADASKDRDAIRKLRKGMVADLNKNIVRAIQLGEAKAKAVQERAMENIANEKKALLTTISTSVRLRPRLCRSAPWRTLPTRRRLCSPPSPPLWRLWPTTCSQLSRRTVTRSLTTSCPSRLMPPLLPTRSPTTSPRVRAATSRPSVTSSRLWLWRVSRSSLSRVRASAPPSCLCCSPARR